MAPKLTPDGPEAKDRGEVAAPSATQAVIMAASAAKFLPPSRFSGNYSDSPERDAESAVSWIESMNDHLRRLALTTAPWSTEIAVEVAMSYMELEALKTARRVRRELGEDASWEGIAVELRNQFAPRASPVDILSKLAACRQDKLPLQRYISDFSKRLDDAVDIGFSDSISATNMFIVGLEEDMQIAVMDSLSNQIEDPWKAMLTKRPSAAVREIAVVAVRKADYVILEKQRKLRAAKEAMQCRVAVVEAPRAAVNTRGDDGAERKARREALVKLSASQFALPQELIRDRISRRVCVRCGDTNHHVRACKAASPVGEAPKGSAH